MLDKKGFDMWADGYDETVNLSESSNVYPFAGYKDVLNTIYCEIKEKKNARVLDIGFGTGVLTTKLYNDGYNITGIDFSVRMIEIAKSKMPDANLIQHDFVKGLPGLVKDRKFDFIISTYAIHHLTDSGKVEFIKELGSHLNEEGSILIGDVAFKKRKELAECKQAAGDGWDDDEHFFVYDEIAGELKFRVSEFVSVSYCAGIMMLKR